MSTTFIDKTHKWYILYIDLKRKGERHKLSDDDRQFLWDEMSYRKYPSLSQHKRLSLEYDINEIEFNIEHNNKDGQEEFVWGDW